MDNGGNTRLFVHAESKAAEQQLKRSLEGSGILVGVDKPTKDYVASTRIRKELELMRASPKEREIFNNRYDELKKNGKRI